MHVTTPIRSETMREEVAMKVKLSEILGKRRDMPDLTEEQRADLRDRLARDNATAQRLREAIDAR